MDSKDELGRAYWNIVAHKYDLTMAVFGGPIPSMVELTTDGLCGADRVLEVAAGTGLVTVALARIAKSVIATDYAPQMVEMLRDKLQARDITNVECQVVDLYELPFPPASFDAVVAANVLHLVPDERAALASLRLALRPGGKLIVPTYCHGETWTARSISRMLAVTGFPGRRRFTLSSLRETVRTSGFEIVQSALLPGILPIGYVEASAQRDLGALSSAR